MAIQDLRAGVGHSDLWVLLGWVDIRRRYRRSALGPFWLTLSMGVMVGGISLVNSGLFGVSMAKLLPSFSIGTVLWMLISTTITEGCTSFTMSDSIIRQSRQPFTVHVLRVMWRNLIIFLHNLLIVVLVLAFLPPSSWSHSPVALLGFLLMLANMAWAALLLGVLCTRFRDLPQIVASLLQLAFFVTPIFWLPTQLTGPRKLIMDFNPFYHMIQIVRAPLLGGAASPASWAASVMMLAVGWTLAIWFFAKFRRRIPYWL
jgi:ABC-type polysaccharide/polyol phosphate export permease